MRADYNRQLWLVNNAQMLALNDATGYGDRMGSLAERIKESRKRQKLSQTAVADLAGMRQQMISKLETGTARYTSRFQQLAEALKVNQAWLITGLGPSDPGAQPSLDDLSVVSALLDDRQREMVARWVRDLLQLSSDE
jgi:transcriptional regulator with XRE-family HTH domain